MTKATGTTDVAVKAEGSVQIAGSEFFDMQDQMEGVEAQLPQIKIIHLAQLFSFPDGTKEETFKGIILDMNRTNAYWKDSYEESGGSPPVCFSLNGVTPEPGSEEIQCEGNTCYNCPQNQYGSKLGKDGKSKGKACKNMKRVHILIEGSAIPYRLTVPPSNLKAVDLYVSLLTSQGIPYQLIITEFSLRSTQNKDGVEYSELFLKNLGAAVKNAEEAQEVKTIVTRWKSIMRGEVITDSEI